MSAADHPVDYTITILEEGFQVLQHLLEYQTPMTLAEITRVSGFSKNKAFRILYTLEKNQFVGRDMHGAYQLGVRFLDFGRHVQDQLDVRVAARPALDWLAEKTLESVFLGVRDGDEALCIEARESPQSIRLFARVGQRAPMYAGGVPKVLLAYMEESERNRLLDKVDLKPLTSSTITGRDQLEYVLRDIRERGFAVTANDMDEGAHSVAAPIRNHLDEVIAAISIAGPSERFDPDTVERYCRLVQEAAALITAKLGNRNPIETFQQEVPATGLAMPNGRWSTF